MKLPNRLRPSDLTLGRLSSGQRQPIMRRASHLHSWDICATALLLVPESLARHLTSSQHSSSCREAPPSPKRRKNAHPRKRRHDP